MIVREKEIIDPNYNNFQVMMTWEKPYMEKCVEFLKPHGDVLEIGFGMGFSATAINKYPLRSYTVIEKDSKVIKKFNKWKLKQKNKKINLIKGMWQYVLPLLDKKYDCIFFDDSPSHEIKRKDNRFFLFLKLIMLRNIKYNTRLVGYATKSSRLYGYLTKHFEYYLYKYRIDIPYYCNYAKGNYMYINKIIFKKQNG
jgi:guanidinoacetate N-methyltransferase|tara:strand:+ start:73 stop:663 length:591 start_codon:yes stop_codon:yes gene_type:complete